MPNKVASTLGIRVGCAVAPYDETNTVFPTDKKFVEIPQIVDIPALSQTRDAIETTPYSATKMKEYIFGLGDSGGALEFQANGKPEILAVWNDDIPDTWLSKHFDPRTEHSGKFTNKQSVVARYKALEGNDAMWLVVIVPDLDLAWYQPIIPDNIGFPDTDVNAAFQPTIPMTPAGQGGWGEIPVTDGEKYNLVSYYDFITAEE